MIKKQKLTLVYCLAVAVLGMNACSQNNAQQVQGEFDNYHERLARVLKIDMALSKDTPTLVLPKIARHRDRHIVAPSNTLSLYDFVRLENCELKRTVANKNNQLGKHMQPANGIVYELNIRKQIDECIPIETSQELVTMLKQAKELKKQSIVADYWQYSFGAQWYGNFTSLTAQPIGFDDENTLLASQQALQAINQWLVPALSQIIDDKNNNEQAKETLNVSLQTLENAKALGALLNSLQLSVRQLQTINASLQTTKKTAVCNKRGSGGFVANKQMDYFNNVVAEYFAKHLQVYLAKLDRQGTQLLMQQQLLLQAFWKSDTQQQNRIKAGTQHKDMQNSTHSALQNMHHFHTQSFAVMNVFKQTIKQHVQELQKVRNACD